MLKADGIGAQAKSVVDEVRKGLGKVSLPIQLTLDPGVTQKLNTEISKLQSQIKPLTIPVNFGMPGGMPGGGGMPWGASSLNLPMLMAQQTQQMIQGLTPTSSPNWSYLMRGSGPGPGPGAAPGGGAGSGNPFNPFGPRGLSRMLGSGLLGYGILAAADFGAGLSNAFNTGSHPERFLREMDSLGSTRNASSDPFMQGQARIMARQGEGKEILGALESVPLAGHLVKLVDSLTGFGRALEDAEKATRRTTELHEYNTKRTESLETAFAALSGDEKGILRVRQKHDADTDKNDEVIAENGVKDAIKGGNQTAIYHAISELARTKRTNRAKAQRRQLEDELQDESQDIRDAASGSRVGVFGLTGEAATRQRAGDAGGALSARQGAARAAVAARYAEKLSRSDLDPNERARLTQERDAELSSLTATQALEGQSVAAGINAGRVGLIGQGRELGFRLSGDTDNAQRVALAVQQRLHGDKLRTTDAGAAAEFENNVAPQQREELERDLRRRRESETEQTATRVKDIEGRAQDDIVRAEGRAFEAMISESKRQTESRVADLRRQAKEQDGVDNKRAANLRDLADAEERAGKRRITAEEENAVRHADLADRASRRESGVIDLQAQGRNREAARANVEARYKDELDQIDPAAPDAVQKFDAASRRRQGAHAMLNRHEELANRSIDIDTAGAAAAARGQAGVGEAMGMLAEFRDMERDAFGNPAQLRRVRALETARIAERQRALTPQASYHDLAGYHDDVQTSIGHGSVHTEALELLARFRGGDGRPDRSKASGAFDSSVGDRGPGAPYPADVASAAKNLNEAAKVIKNAKVIGVIGGNN